MLEQNLKITLFIPTRNEIVGIQHIMPQLKNEWVDEIICVDGHSTDGTPEWLESRGYRVIRQTGKGLTDAYWECFKAAKGDVIVAFSPDNNSVPELIPQLIEKIRDGYEVVTASRYLGGAKSEDDDWVTAFGNWMFTRITNLIFRSKYTDALVMYRAFHKSLVQELELDIAQMPALEIQMMIRCAKTRRKVCDIPGDEPKRLGGVRKMSPIYNGLSILYCILREVFVWRVQ